MELLPKKQCINCLESFLANRALLSISTASVLEATVQHLKGTTKVQNKTMVIKIISDALEDEIGSVTKGAALHYLGEKVADALIKAELI